MQHILIMFITGLKYSQVNSLLLCFSPLFISPPREDRKVKIQYLNRPVSLSEHMEGAGLRETKDRMKIKEQRHVKSDSHKYILFVIY